MPDPLHQRAFTQWMTGDPTNPAAPTQANLGPSPVFRDAKDRTLAAWGATPEAQYPDGYLGTQPSTSRRSDKLVDAVYRTNQRPQTRGVHKGERINPGDYLWPEEFNPMTGIEYEAQGLEWAPSGLEPQRLVNDGKVGPRGIPVGDSQPVEAIDMQRRSMLSHLLPDWH